MPRTLQELQLFAKQLTQNATKSEVGDRVTDGFDYGTVIKVEVREHGKPDYIVLMDGYEDAPLYEECYLNKVTE